LAWEEIDIRHGRILIVDDNDLFLGAAGLGPAETLWFCSSGH